MTMKVRSAAVLVAWGLGLAACGPAEIRIDQAQGVPEVKGSTEVNVPTDYVCGTPIMAGGKSVTTRVIASVGCEFTFDDTLQVLQASDYRSIPDLGVLEEGKVATNLVQRVELNLTKFALTDAATGTALDLATRITTLTLLVNGQQVADKSTISRLPAVVKLEGTALNGIKASVDKRQPASVQVKAVAVLPDQPRPPERLKLEYQAQPALIIGPGKIF